MHFEAIRRTKFSEADSKGELKKKERLSAIAESAPPIGLDSLRHRLVYIALYTREKIAEHA